MSHSGMHFPATGGSQIRDQPLQHSKTLSENRIKMAGDVAHGKTLTCHAQGPRFILHHCIENSLNSLRWKNVVSGFTVAFTLGKILRMFNKPCLANNSFMDWKIPNSRTIACHAVLPNLKTSTGVGPQFLQYAISPCSFLKSSTY